jgi:hypothetical protein
MDHISRPTKEFATHHKLSRRTLDEPPHEEAWRVRTRLETLVDFSLHGESRGDAISPEEYDAGLRWRRDSEMAQIGETPSVMMLLLSGGGGGGPSSGPAEGRLRAIRRMAETREAMGTEATLVLMASVVLDLSWRKVAQVSHAAGYRCNSDHTARSRACKALRELRVYYDTLDGAAASRKRAQRIRSVSCDYSMENCA